MAKIKQRALSWTFYLFCISFQCTTHVVIHKINIHVSDEFIPNLNIIPLKYFFSGNTFVYELIFIFIVIISLFLNDKIIRIRLCQKSSSLYSLSDTWTNELLTLCRSFHISLSLKVCVWCLECSSHIARWKNSTKRRHRHLLNNKKSVIWLADIGE